MQHALVSRSRATRGKITGMNWQARISVNPDVRSGKPCIKGTRITVYDVLEYLAGGDERDRDSQRLSGSDTRGYSGLTGLRGRA